MADFRVAIAGAGGRMGAANIRAVTAADGCRRVRLRPHRGSGHRPGCRRAGGHRPARRADRRSCRSGARAGTGHHRFHRAGRERGAGEEGGERGLVHIIGTTGLSEDDEAAIRQAAKAGARIVKAGNFSLGVNLLMGLVKKAAAELPGFDIEILEMHHNRKVDAPRARR
jgi:4-hydroxy-tetrahydrodipicolinate reductase